jgi:hypothetical protein
VTAPPASFLATRRGRLLLLLCAVQFLDAVDSSIMNVALPSIRRDLGFSARGLQCVLSGYLVTYKGLLLPTEPLSAEQAVDEALTPSRSTGDHGHTRRLDRSIRKASKGAVVEAIKTRLAAPQPAR